eukprot:gene18197-20013_t
MLINVIFYLFLLIPETVNCIHPARLRSGLYVIRDKVTPEEISRVILNPRKRDIAAALTSFNSHINTRAAVRANDDSSSKSKNDDDNDDAKRKAAQKMKRDLRAIQIITTKAKRDSGKNDVTSATEDYVASQSRLKRIVYSPNSNNNNKKSKSLPAVFLTAVARVVVPARPESSSSKISSAEALPRLLRLHDVRRSSIRREKTTRINS